MSLQRIGERLWIGIGNDVLQLFIQDPPAGTYSMVRHHALMLAAATAWLGPEAMRVWGALHASAGARFVRNQHRPLWAAVLQTMPAKPEPWLVHAVADLHPDPDFNRAWIERVVIERGA